MIGLGPSQVMEERQSTLSTRGGHSKKAATCKPGRKLSPEPDHAGFSDSQPPDCEKKKCPLFKCLLFKSPVCAILYGSLNRRRQMVTFKLWAFKDVYKRDLKKKSCSYPIFPESVCCIKRHRDMRMDCILLGVSFWKPVLWSLNFCPLLHILSPLPLSLILSLFDSLTLSPSPATHIWIHCWDIHVMCSHLS